MKFTLNLNKKEFSMKKAKMLSLTASLVLAIIFTLSCSSPDDGDNSHTDTYYMESGSVSVYAYEWSNSNPGVSAYDMLRILNQYPVIPDPYKDAQRGVSRKELEAELSLDVPGFSKEQFLRLLDTTGAAIQFFIMLDGGYFYFFVEREF